MHFQIDLEVTKTLLNLYSQSLNYLHLYRTSVRKEVNSMILRKLNPNRLITINYYKEGLLQTCQGYFCNFDWYQQAIFLRDEHQKIYSINLSVIKEVD
jgi:YolD-like protein